MAFHYIISRRGNLSFLLLGFIFCLYGSRVTAQTGPPEVTSLKETNVTETSIEVNWELPSSITEFQVLYTNGSAKEERNVTGNHFKISNLLPGVNYNITVYSKNGTEISSGVTISVTTLPSVVDGLQVSNVSGNNFTISWTFSSDINAKYYTYNVAGEGPMFKNLTGVKVNSILVSGLQIGTNYNIVVYAVTENGNVSKASNPANATTLPSAVKDLNISNRSTDAVTVSWTKSSDPNENTYTYTLECSGTPFQKLVNLKSTSTVVGSLQPGSDYNCTIYAVTSNGIYGPASKIANATTLPSLVKDLIIFNISTHEVTVSWTKSSDPNQNTYSYTVDGNGPGFVKQTGLKTTSTAVPSLEAGTDYNFTVYAVTENEVYSQPSNVAVATTRPSKVPYFDVSTVMENTVKLIWTFPSDIHVSTYTYTVEDINTGQIVKDIHENHTIVSNLSAGVNYRFTIYTVTPNKVTSSSNPVINTTTMPSIVRTFMVASKTNQSVNLNWTFPENINVWEYTYTVEVFNSNANRTFSSIKDNFTTVKDLSAGETYNFTIYTVTSNGIRSFNYPFIMDTTMPNEPQSITGYATGEDNIFIAWNPPVDFYASSYQYNVEWYNLNLNENKGLNTTEKTDINISGLFPGNLYKIGVTTVYRNTLSVTASEYVQTNPISTENFKVVNITNTTATLQWDLQSHSNSIVNGYLVSVWLSGNNAYNKTTQDMNIVMDSLKPGFIYKFIVESIASNSISRKKRTLSQRNSEWISYSTPKTIYGETVPDAVINPTCAKVDGYQIKVEFGCPDGNYSEIQVVVNNRPNYNCSCTKSNVISGLQPAKEYMVTIITQGTAKKAVTTIYNCNTDSTGVIVGSVLGILLFLLLIGLLAFYVIRKRRDKGMPKPIRISTRRQRYHTIAKERFRLHYENNHANSDFGFADEYQELSTVGISQSKIAAELPENKSKNRFSNVLPYDHSRVKLNTVNETASTDYINANFMPGYNSSKEFIASQGPLPNTTADFWRMVWEHHVNTIVMLTNCMENGRIKCERYWPLDYTPCTYEDITVTVTSETILPEWTTRDFSVKHAKQPRVQYVRHFHFTAWPDHGVPDSTLSIIHFRTLVREHMDQRRSNGPTVVHCSAGVGRTGTLIALDYLIQQMEKEHRIGIYGCVEKMRMNRGLMVQTEDQYIFLNKCMLDLIEQPSEENIYENQNATDLIYENAAVVRNFQNENASL